MDTTNLSGLSRLAHRRLLTCCGGALLVLMACAAPRSEPAATQPPVPPPASVELRPTTVIVVRHARRADSGEQRDPDLSPQGLERAEALARALEHAGIQAIYTTQYLRTRRTAEPLAQRLGIAPETLAIGPGGLRAHVEDVRAAVERHRGGTLLVVGHSNTVAAIVGALAGQDLPQLGEGEYDTLDVVALPPPGEQHAPPRLLRLRW